MTPAVCVKKLLFGRTDEIPMGGQVGIGSNMPVRRDIRTTATVAHVEIRGYFHKAPHGMCGGRA